MISSSTNISDKSSGFNRLPMLSLVCIFAALFFIGFIVVSFLATILNTFEIEERTRILITSSVQNIFVFIIPALIVARIESKKTLSLLTLNKLPACRNIIAVVACYMIGYFCLNQIIYYNESISFPASMHGIETALRELEDNGKHFTDVLLSDNTVSGLISGVLVIGILTGLAEELFFRAGIQRLLYKGMPANAAIWVAAIIFSTMHFQFFGFVPRLLLGALFGYLYFWSNSIWTSVFAHALNNSLVVVSAWLTTRNIYISDIESWGVVETGFPWPAIISACALSLFLWKAHKCFLPERISKKIIK